MPAHTERAFEEAIEHGLTTQGGYARRAPADYDEERASPNSAPVDAGRGVMYNVAREVNERESAACFASMRVVREWRMQLNAEAQSRLGVVSTSR